VWREGEKEREGKEGRGAERGGEKGKKGRGKERERCYIVFYSTLIGTRISTAYLPRDHKFHMEKLKLSLLCLHNPSMGNKMYLVYNQHEVCCQIRPPFCKKRMSGFHLNHVTEVLEKQIKTCRFLSREYPLCFICRQSEMVRL
jgi:hypothetical protein